MEIRDLPTDVAQGGDGRSTGPRLVVVWNGGTLVHPLPAEGSLVIGRGAEADVRIDHTSVSRRHAILHLGEPMRVEDLGSSNGTWVEGKRLERNASADVRPGVLFEVGSVLLVVHSGPRPAAPPDVTPGEPVVVDPQMQRVHELVDLVARSALSVILLGETGVGKELLASRVHAQSPRAAGPFLKINCAALMESLLESELFGHERGAFTGAAQAKVGLLEGASGGTLFLDEVGELPLALQAKLLRVLESGEVTRVGSLKPRPVDVRFVSATNRDLREWVAAGRFRQDLFFRLDGISIRIPPLRERTTEIPALAEAFVREACASAGRAPIGISHDAMARLVHHLWPGNIRELRNVIARSVLLCSRGKLEPADLRFDAVGMAPSSPPPSVVDLSRVASPSAPPPAPSAPPAPPSAPPPAPSAPPPAPSSAPSLDAEEVRRIRDALEKSAGNQTRAAKLLGVSRRTLLKRLDAMDVPRPRKRDDEE
jgi:two-component system response regulator AtoC